MVGAPGEAEDVLQVVFLYVWEQAHRYDDSRGVAAAWLSVITRSRCLDHLRKRSRGRELPVESDVLEAISGARTPWGDLELGRVLAEAMRDLPSVQREAVENVYFKGLTQLETSKALNVPLGTVKSRIRLAMDSLAQSLGKVRDKA